MFALALLLHIGCSSQPDEPAVARVGDEYITAAELLAFAAPIPDGIHQGKSDAEADAALLDALIDKKLLLMEAKAQQVDKDPSLVRELSAFADQAILTLYNQLTVDRFISFTEEDLLQHHRATNRDRALRIAMILVESVDKAEEILAQLKNGADFHQLVEAHSVAEITKAWGGDTGRYLRRDGVDRAHQSLFALQVGEVSQPLTFTYKSSRHYAVFKILDEIPVPLSTVEDMVEEEVFGAKRAVLSKALVDSLINVYKPQVQSKTAALLAERAAAGDMNLSAAQAAQQLATYRSGDLTLAEFLPAVLHKTTPETLQQLADTAWVASKALGMITARIMLEEARALNLHQDADLLARIANKHQDLLVSRLRKLSVDSHITITKEEARAFFDQNPEKFLYVAGIFAAEVLLPSQEQAQEVKRQLEEGADAEQLIAQHDTRAVHSEKEGFLRLDVYNRVHYPHMYDAVQDLKVGEVGGPLKVPEGYSVFKVIRREPAKPKSFNAASQKRAAAYVRIDKAKRGYVTYVRHLREKYGIEIFPAHIPSMIKDGKLQSTASVSGTVSTVGSVN